MERRDKKRLTRREFIELGLGAAAAVGAGSLAGCAHSGGAAIARRGPAEPVRLINCNLVDVSAGAVIAAATVCMAEGKIVSAGREAPPPAPGEKVIDAGGRYVIPGLIDAHCHTTFSCTFAMPPTQGIRHLRQLHRQLAACIETGVTTVRDVGSLPKLLREFVSEIEAGERPGPRVVSCNGITNIDGGHPDIVPTDVNPLADFGALFLGVSLARFTDDDDLARWLESNHVGARFVKLTVDRESMLCGKGAIPAYSDAHLRTIFDFADKKSLPVVCHCATKWGFDRLMHYPVHSFEHVVADEPFTDADLKALVDKKISVVPTITLAQSYLVEEAYQTLPAKYLDDFSRHELDLRREYLHNVPASHCDPVIHEGNMQALGWYKRYGWANLLRRKKFMIKPEMFCRIATIGAGNVRKMRAAGVQVGVGMDAGTPLNYFGSLYRELEILGRLGYKNADVLRAATQVNARILGMQSELGAVAPGRLGDLVVLDKNPLEDITTCRAPRMVFKEGRVVHAAA